MLGFISTWWQYRGTRVITCPDNLKAAAVKVNAFSSTRALHLKTCSRWPEMAGCRQDCVSQIVASPESCAVKTIVENWYEGKRCYFCAKAIGEIVWHERPPAVRLSSGVTTEWKGVPPQDLPETFARGKAVCWVCHIRETFRREHKELVVDRVRPVEPKVIIPPSVSVY